MTSLTRTRNQNRQRQLVIVASVVTRMSIAYVAASSPSHALGWVTVMPQSSLAWRTPCDSAFVARLICRARTPAVPRDAHDLLLRARRKSDTRADPDLPLRASSDSGAREPRRAVTDSESSFHCYLLRSLDPDHPRKTYVGFTTDPRKRLRQHNGDLKGGARRTKRGRPWGYVALIDGFQSKATAMSFEWAWQHVGRSKVFRAAVSNQFFFCK